MQSFTAANINDVRIRWRDRNRTDGCRRLIVKDRLPCPAVIVGFENAAVYRRHVENIRLRRDPRDRARSPAAIRPSVSPAQNRIEFTRARLRNPQKNRENENDRAVYGGPRRCKRPFIVTGSRCSGGRVGRNSSSFRSHKPPLSSANPKGAIEAFAVVARVSRARELQPVRLPLQFAASLVLKTSCYLL